MDRMDTSDDGAFQFKQRRGRAYRFPTRNILFRRPRGFGRRGYRTNFRRTGTQALKEVRKLKRDINSRVEKKVATATVSINLAAGVAQYITLAAMPQGTTGATRIGDKITIETLAWKLRLAVADTETLGASLRVVIVYDRKPLGAAATWQQVFHLNDINALMNMDNQYRGRFQVLYDQMFGLNVAGEQMKFTKGFLKANKKVLYNGNAGTVADIQYGHLFMMAMSQSNDQNANISGYMRIRYSDD